MGPDDERKLINERWGSALPDYTIHGEYRPEARSIFGHLVDENNGELMLTGWFFSDLSVRVFDGGGQQTFDVAESMITDKGRLCFKFKSPAKISIVFDAVNSLTNLNGLPAELDGNLHIDFCQNLKVWAGVPKKILGNLEVGCPAPIEDLSNHVSEVGVLLLHPKWTIKRPLLSLLKINKLFHIAPMRATAGGISWHETDRWQVAVGILNEHLRKGKNILACQEELIDNDLEEYAQL